MSPKKITVARRTYIINIKIAFRFFFFALFAFSCGCVAAPEQPDSAPQTPLLQGDELFLKADYNKAYQFYITFLANYTDSPYAAESSLRAALCLVKLNQLPAAIEQLRRTQGMKQPSYIRAITAKTLGDAYRISEDYRAAVEQYDGALAGQNGEVIPEEITYYKGISLLRLAEWERGYAELQKAAGSNPEGEFGRLARDKINYQHRHFAVQLGAFRNRENAEKRLGELKSRGVSECYIEEQTLKGDPLFCIRLGKFPAYREARAQAENLRKSNIDAIVLP